MIKHATSDTVNQSILNQLLSCHIMSTTVAQFSPDFIMQTVKEYLLSSLFVVKS